LPAAAATATSAGQNVVSDCIRPHARASKKASCDFRPLDVDFHYMNDELQELLRARHDKEAVASAQIFDIAGCFLKDRQARLGQVTTGVYAVQPIKVF
jgi:hypothetical protein